MATAAPVGAAPSSVVITQPQTVLGENSAGVVAGRRRAGNHGVDSADNSADNFENNPGYNSSGNNADNSADNIIDNTGGHWCYPAPRWRFAH